MRNRISATATMSGLLAAAVHAAAIAAAPPAPPAPVMSRAMAISATDPSIKWSACPPVFAPGCELAVLRGDPAQPNADVLLRVPGGYTIAPHTHTSAERMILLSGRLEVRYAGNAPVTLQVGDYAYGPPRLPHEARCLGSTPCTLFIAFELPVDALPHAGAVD
jgi:quercetin dioxygenase-like cupin family protein